jgi:hypothetical protein
MRWAVHVTCIGEMRVAYIILVEIPEGKKPLERWEGIRIDLTEINFGGVDWIWPTYERGQWWMLVNTVMNLRIL